MNGTKNNERKIPIIGIPGWKTGENSFGITIPYMEFFNQYGITKVLPLVAEVDQSIDLLVLPGGADIDPLRYNAFPQFATSKPDLLKEYFDTKVLPKYIANGTPIFGICRGMQSIAVHFGSKLIQDIPKHETNDTNRSEPVHALVLINNNFNREFRNNKKVNTDGLRVKVNSMHHQCVSNKGFPDELDIIAIYTGKSSSSVIEAIKHRELPIMGVQYHPEELGFDILSDYMIETLITKSKNYGS